MNPRGCDITAGGGDAKNSFAIIAIDRVFKELVVLAILYLQSSRILRCWKWKKLEVSEMLFQFL